jgi:hypothetical protein
VPAHLALALSAIGKRDRELDNRETRQECSVGHLDLEAVALPGDLVERDRLEYRASEALEATCQVSLPCSQDQLCVEAAAPADRTTE